MDLTRDFEVRDEETKAGKGLDGVALLESSTTALVAEDKGLIIDEVFEIFPGGTRLEELKGELIRLDALNNESRLLGELRTTPTIGNVDEVGLELIKVGTLDFELGVGAGYEIFEEEPEISIERIDEDELDKTETVGLKRYVLLLMEIKEPLEEIGTKLELW
jgi:hypothetical protein